MWQAPSFTRAWAQLGPSLKAEPEKKLEFALWLVIRCKDNQTQEQLTQQYPIPNKFNELSLKIWRTQNQKILTEMAII